MRFLKAIWTAARGAGRLVLPFGGATKRPVLRFIFRTILLALVLVGFVAVYLGSSLPGGFIPTEDQGYMFLALQLPDGASAQRTDAAQQKITSALLKTPGIEGVIAVTNFSLLTQVQSTNAGFFFVNLKPWAVRKSKQEQLEYIQANLQLLEESYRDI